MMRISGRRSSPTSSRSQRGVTLIEVLVSLVILMIGLLGLVGLMVQSQRSQVESYQRVQALLLMQDMVAKMNTNRAVASCYVFTAAPTYLGKGNSTLPVATCASGTAAQQARVAKDLNTWLALLLGSAEVSGTDQVGAVLGARGCISFDATTNLYQVSVAWQGNSATGAPPAGVICGKDLYGADAQRRAVSVTLQI